MPQLTYSKASLRIGGDDLQPNDITSLMNCEPTKAWRLGETKSPAGRLPEIHAKTGMWILDATKHEPGDLDAQIIEIFSQLPANPSLWNQLNGQYKMDLFCGLFMDEANEGLVISATSLKILGDRGIELQLDLYSPGDKT